jgi:hypothetical protein
MDRLAAYYHWNDPQALDQAICVALQRDVDLGRIEAWSEREAAMAKFEKFVEQLDRERSKP